MRKRTTLALVALIVFASIVKASPVDPQRAIQVAQEFVPKSTSAQKAPMRGSQSEPSSSIVYTHMMPNSARPAFYIINVEDGAFVIVSADDIAHQVLGYSLSSTWPVAKDGSVELPEHIKGFFDDLAAQMEAAIEAEPNRTPESDWTNSRPATRRSSPELPGSVGPLLTTTWNQGKFYNALCPEDANGPDGHVYAGCVATAMAQIVKYWSEQIQGRGGHSYETNYGKLTVNYENEIYDFNDMSTRLDESSTQEQVSAVAKLIYHCGVAANMNYGPSESSAYETDARAGLINFFRFSSDLSYAEKALFSDKEWNDLLRDNIASNHPVIYCGRGTGAHAFVCDGYRTDDYFHFNFGWDGFCDGWYLTSAVKPAGTYGVDYSGSQSVLVGIVPDNTGNVILGQTTGTSTFVVDEPLELYNILGQNTYEVMNCYGFDNLLCNNTVTFIPADETRQMIVSIIEVENQGIQIYNGTSTNNFIRDLKNGSDLGSNIDLNPVVSSENAITLTSLCKMYSERFKIGVSQENDCNVASNIAYSVESTTVHLKWTGDNDETKWQVEYGIKGFELGNGTVYNATSNTATFENLEKLTEYDFYIRSVNNDNQYGLVNKVTLMVEAPYWQDVVMTQPASYSIDKSTGYAIISTAEDFVWFTKSGKYGAIIVSDIDFDGYKWKPVYRTYSHIKGNGHTISNLYINEKYYNNSLFCISSGIIEGLGIENSRINGLQQSGGICSANKGSIINCHVSNTEINGTEVAGGITAVNQGIIENCYADVNISGSRLAGLLTGSNYGTLSNCYAVGTAQSNADGYYASISAYAGAGIIKNCYSVDLPMGIIGYEKLTEISDTSSFFMKETQWTLRTPVCFEEEKETDLIDALNKGMMQMNDSILRVWETDSNSTNKGLPKLGDYYYARYPHVTNLTVENAKINNLSCVIINWKEMGGAEKWEIKYQPLYAPNDSAIIIVTDSRTDTLYNIPLGEQYTFSVRSVFDKKYHSSWVSEIEMVDVPLWTDIVTEQPEGFVEDSNGDIYISSAEGLVWLSVQVNGLHNKKSNDFKGKKISLTSDINLEGYRWYPIGNSGSGTTFSGCFLGNNHTISNLYINSNKAYLGLFGSAIGASFSGVSLRNGSVNYYNSQAMYGSGGGGLIGSGGNGLKITDCSSNITVKGKIYVGSLCGSLSSYDEDEPIVISNCYATGNVYGRQAVGGLIGEVYGAVIIKNCYATGNVLLNLEADIWPIKYHGGLIGYFASNSIAENCYSTGNVGVDEDLANYYNHHDCYSGSVIGCSGGNPKIHYVYGLLDDSKSLTFNFETYGLIIDTNGNLLDIYGNVLDTYDIADTSSFVNSNGIQTLITPIAINNNTYDNLLDALNAWVADAKDPLFKTWKADTSNINGGYPVFGDNYEPSCYSPTNVTVSNATIVGDTIIRTRIEWEQKGNPSSWEILYVGAQQSLDKGTIIPVNTKTCELTNLPVGKILDIYVRAKNNDEDISGWSELVRYIPDKLHWTEVVTSKPEGYKEDGNGNVFISSAEGLAWLASVVNGLNGEPSFLVTENSYDSDGNAILFYRNKNINKIYLTKDIDVSEYRWTSMYAYNWDCVFEGNGHVISGLYCNEYADGQGLFSRGLNRVQNLVIRDCSISGLNYCAAIIGCWMDGSVINCIVNGEVQGVEDIGGIVGYQGLIINSAFVGMVSSRNDITLANCQNGYVGGISYSGTIENSYVAAKIPSSPHSSILSSGRCNNTYALYYPTKLPFNFLDSYYANNEIYAPIHYVTNSSFFTGSGTTWTLTEPQNIGDSIWSDLVDALNAWVDVNNSSGQYRHWVADTAFVNGGFPIFAPMPGDVNGDGTVDISDYIGVANYILGHAPEGFNETAADVNNDGTIDISDYIGVANIILKGKP